MFWFLQALTPALTFHEKGRSVLKKRNYAEALLLLLEAEKEFRYSAAMCKNQEGIVGSEIKWVESDIKGV